MPPVITQEFPRTYCVNILSRLLELAMQTAEAASTAKDHRLVLQAAREVTRLVSLITKISSPQTQQPKLQGKPALGSASRGKTGPQTGKWEKCGENAAKTGVLEEFFKKNLPVNSCSNTSRTNVSAHPPGDANKARGQTAAAIRWQDEPVTLMAAESQAA